jgi:hypothetical protein
VWVWECINFSLDQQNIDATPQNFIYKHTVDLENVQRNKKKEKGGFTGLKLDVKISPC